MGKPIYRVIVDFEYRNKSTSNYKRTLIKEGTIDTFSLSKNKDEIYKHIESRILSKIKKKKDKVEIKLTNIKIEGQYGETQEMW